jgi:hypothetical protein
LAREEIHTKVWLEKFKERDHVGDSDGKIKIKWNLKNIF